MTADRLKEVLKKIRDGNFQTGYPAQEIARAALAEPTPSIGEGEGGLSQDLSPSITGGAGPDSPPITDAEPTLFEYLREQAYALEPHEQHRLAEMIAANVGYDLRKEDEHPDSPHGSMWRNAFEALSWAYDLIELYDGRLVALGEPAERVYDAAHMNAKRQAFRALVALGAYAPQVSARSADGVGRAPRPTGQLRDDPLPKGEAQGLAGDHAVGTLRNMFEALTTHSAEISRLTARVAEVETEVLVAALSDKLDEAGSPLSWRERAETAEAALRERDERIGELEKALQRLAEYPDCGCVPCTGQCRSESALQIELDARIDYAREALTQVRPRP